MCRGKVVSVADKHGNGDGHGSSDEWETGFIVARDGELRKTGIDIIGDVPWGTHFCQFYQTKQDLIDTLVPYFTAGLTHNEFCMWVTAEPLDVGDATQALRRFVPDLDARLAEGQIEIIPYSDWYVRNGRFDQQEVLDGWVTKLDAALAKGYTGLRLTGNTFWLEKEDWQDFTDYEEAVNSVIGNYRMLAVCTYSVDKCGASEIADVVANHEFAMMKRHGKWSVIESSTVRQTKQALQNALDELEARSGNLERLNEELTATTEELEAMNEELMAAEDELRDEIDVRRRTEEALRESEQRVRQKLDSILSPEGDVGALALADVIDVPAVQSLMSNFYELAQIPLAILDLGGKVLVGEGWQDICTKFHRAHPDTCRYCLESDTELTSGLAHGEFKLYKCKNNMWDVVTPITVGGKHVGNVFSGQFFLEDDSIDYDFFRAQAGQYGFDAEEYVAALQRVPRLSRERVDQAMAFLIQLADMLSKLSYSNIKLARSLAERDALTDSLRERSDRLNRAQEIAHLGSWELDVMNDKLTWSDEVYRIFGLRPQESVATYEAFLDAVHPDDRAAVDAAYSSSLRDGRATYEIEHRIIRESTGEVRNVHEKCEHFVDGNGTVVRSIGMVLDVTDRKRIDERQAELYAREHHIAEVLQKALIPDSAYEFSDCEIAVRYEPTSNEAEVGGDFYDIFDLDDNKVGLLIGDVAGKGLAAAIQVAAARHAVRSYAYIDPRPAKVMSLANDALSRDIREDVTLLTAFFAVVDLEVGVMTYANGGHETPLLKCADGTVEELYVDGRALGVAGGYDYSDRSVILKPHDLLMMVTDGITEARCDPKCLFGLDGLKSYLRETACCTADELADGLLQAAKAHAGGALNDDAAIVVFGLRKK